jgi:hypothetical protein
MGLFTKPAAPKITAVKLYSIGEPPDREALLSCVLARMEALAQKGHDKYYALDGETKKCFGFNLLLGARSGRTAYSVLVLWYDPAKY